MALLNQSIQTPAQLSKFFDAIRQGTAPQKFNRQFLKDIGFTSSNHLGFIPLLKGLGFLSSDGTPTERYRSYLDPTKSKIVLAEAVREAYSDIFVIKARPTSSDKDAISGKFKSTYNLSDLVAERSARTFLALTELCDQNTLFSTSKNPSKTVTEAVPTDALMGFTPLAPAGSNSAPKSQIGLHYNIEIHLPATKDVEVYNAIFKALRSHVIE